jgi:transcriptional regulator with XRE-family HTH domain
MQHEISFGAYLKQRRHALDLTQEEVAARVGCATETIRKLEAGGRRPSKEIAQRLAEVLIAEPAARQPFLKMARGRTPDEPVLPTTAPSLAPPRHNLPAPLTSFIGREREVADVRHRLATSRLVTLTGVGGTGKTRLALEVATILRDDYAGGVWVIELATLTDPVLVPQTVATVLGLREEGGRPLLATLQAALQAAPTLLLLDNCEHLITACAELADTLLHACPPLRILATSREALGSWARHSIWCPHW